MDCIIVMEAAWMTNEAQQSREVKGEQEKRREKNIQNWAQMNKRSADCDKRKAE